MPMARVTSRLSGPGFSLEVSSEGTAVQSFALNYGESRVVWDATSGLTLTHEDSGEITGGHKMAPIVRRGADFPDSKILAAIRAAPETMRPAAHFVVDLIERHAQAFGKRGGQRPRSPYAFLYAIGQWHRARQAAFLTELAASLRREQTTAAAHWQPHIEEVAALVTRCAADTAAADALWRDVAEMERIEAAANASEQLHEATVALLNRCSATG